MSGKQKSTALPDMLKDLTLALIDDYNLLRTGRITLPEARVRAQLAREALRSIHTQIDVLQIFSDSAKILSKEENR